MYLYSCIIFVSFITLDSQHSTLGKILKIMMIAPSVSLTVDLDFLVIWSPIFLSQPSSNDLSAGLIPLLSLFTKKYGFFKSPEISRIHKQWIS